MHDDEHPDGLTRCSTVSSTSSPTRIFGKLSAVSAVVAAELFENESVNAERQRSRVRSKGVKYSNEESHAQFGNELVKSGSESTIGRMNAN